MRTFNILKALVESQPNQAGRRTTDKFFNVLEDSLEELFAQSNRVNYRAMSEYAHKIVDQLESDVLRNLVKEADFPVTQTKAAKVAAARVLKAVAEMKGALSDLENEVQSLNQEFGMHFDGSPGGDDIDFEYEGGDLDND